MPRSPSPRTFRIMLTACVALLLAGVLSAFVVSDDDTVTTADDAASRDARATTTARAEGQQAPTSTVSDGAGPSTTAANGVAPDTTAAPATTTSTLTGSTPPTTATPTSSAPPTSASADPKPTPAGTYRYDTEGTTTIGTTQRDLPPVTTLTVGEVGDDGRQVQVRDLRDDNGDGTITRTTFRYADEGIYLERIQLESSFSGIGQTSVLTADAPYLLIPADVRDGTTTTGRLSGDGIVADITFTVHHIGAENTSTGLLAELSGDVEGTQTSDMVVRTSDRLTVSETGDSDVRSGGFRVRSHYTASLQD